MFFLFSTSDTFTRFLYYHTATMNNKLGIKWYDNLCIFIYNNVVVYLLLIQYVIQQSSDDSLCSSFVCFAYKIVAFVSTNKL